MKWKLVVFDYSKEDITPKKFNEKIEKTEGINFEKLTDVWNYLGFKLNRQRCGYSYRLANKEWVLIRTF